MSSIHALQVLAPHMSLTRRCPHSVRVRVDLPSNPEDWTLQLLDAMEAIEHNPIVVWNFEGVELESFDEFLGVVTRSVRKKLRELFAMDEERQPVVLYQPIEKEELYDFMEPRSVKRKISQERV